MDGAFYNDLREPFLTVAPGAVTLASTAKALYTTSQFPVLGGDQRIERRKARQARRRRTQ